MSRRAFDISIFEVRDTAFNIRINQLDKSYENWADNAINDYMEEYASLERDSICYPWYSVADNKQATEPMVLSC